jgi:hypothetical protein
MVYSDRTAEVVNQTLVDTLVVGWRVGLVTMVQSSLLDYHRCIVRELD